MLAFASALSLSAHADDQPVNVDDLEIFTCPKELEYKGQLIVTAVDELLTKNRVEAAAELASDCANWGSSMDVAILSPVIDRQYTELNKILTGKVQTQMEKMIAKCTAKGEAEGGTLGRAVAAHCAFKVVAGFYAAYRE